MRLSNSSRSGRGCLVADRLRLDLELVGEVLRREGVWKDAPVKLRGTDCIFLEEEWFGAAKSALGRLEGRSVGAFHRLQCAIKGTKRLWDFPCAICDMPRASRAKRDWMDKMLGDRIADEHTTSQSFLQEVKSRVREVMGKRWRRKHERTRLVPSVPDQQGCLERCRADGGTLSVEESEGACDSRGVYPTDSGELAVECSEVNLCRIGVCKTKGKFRVVTMQGAKAKRILRPVHKAAYDHISKFAWCRRGELRSYDFTSIADELEEGEYIISGDYTASTDNLHVDAVLAVVDVLAEGLEGEEREVLLESFRGVQVVTRKGKRHLVVRGSMMGNLCSFVVLCLLNFVCLSAAKQRVRGEGPYYRPCRINGDDCVFGGDDVLFEKWVEVCGWVGFVINREKTGRHRRFAELNSQPFDCERQRFIRKLNFGWLCSSAHWKPDQLACAIFDTAQQMSFPTAAWFLSHPRVRSILCRVPIPVSVVPKRWWNFLVKRWWFRRALIQGEPEIVNHGYAERALPYVKGPIISRHFHSSEIELLVEKAEALVVEDFLDRVQGVEWCPPEREISLSARRGEVVAGRCIRLSRGTKVWKRLWLKPVLEGFRSVFGERSLDDDCSADWIDDQRGLVVDQSISFDPVFAGGTSLGGFGVAPPLLRCRRLACPCDGQRRFVPCESTRIRDLRVLRERVGFGQLGLVPTLATQRFHELRKALEPSLLCLSGSLFGLSNGL